MRVLTVGNSWDEGRGGYEAVWRAWVRAARAAGHEVEVLEPGTKPWWLAGGAPRRRGGGAVQDAWRAAVEELRPFDAVAWFALGGLPMDLLRWCRDVPQLAVVHDGWPVYGPEVDRRHAPVRWDALTWVSYNSRFARDEVAARVPALAGRPGSVDHPGIDPARFPPSDPPAEWGGRLALLGRVEPRKGVAEAISALDELPGAQLTVTGPVENRALKAEHPQVRWVGQTTQPAKALAAADCVLFPVTWQEPFGLVPLEAMAVGRPVVATGTGGSAEYLRDGENCLLVAPGDPPALAAAVRRLAGDPELRARLVAGGRATAAEHDEAAWARRLVERLESLG